VSVNRLWLTNFRNHASVDVVLDPGVTLVVGANGQGKTNLIEAIAWLARGSSFRGAPNEALIRHGADQAVVRAEVTRGERTILLEAEITSSGRNRILVNSNRVPRMRNLLEHFRTTVFGPEDLGVVKGGPGGRRGWVDDLLADVNQRNHSLRTDLDRILRQRNALLKQARGRLTDDVATTLDVWDAKLGEVGENMAAARREIIGALEPLVGGFLEAVSGGTARISMVYYDEWSADGLVESLRRARGDDIRRGVSTVGPHRDDVMIQLDGLPTRTHSSQGEQRSVALAMRLAGHSLVVDRTGTDPVVLLDDVFSELDDDRVRALVGLLPATQSVITTAGTIPDGVEAGKVVHLAGGVFS
jgi:DNA replication and repair protein RecF